MIRPGAQAAAKAVAAAAATLLVLAGCKPLTTAGSPAPAGTAAPAQSGALITEPQAGFSPVYHLIKHARHSIDLTMYEFTDTRAEHDLAAAAQRGVSVKVVLDQREKSHNSAAFGYLRSHGVKVVWSSPRFEYTHQKTLLVDGSTAVIMTANLTSEYYSSTRDFLVMDTKAADVAAIAQVFSADFAHRPIQPGDGRDLVWSPAGSQAKLLALIGGATKSLRIYSEEMGDTTIEDALIEAAKRGVNVKVCGENPGGEYDSDFSRLAAAGVHISYYSSSHGFYIHGKVIEADYGTGRAKVFIGSENFSSTSLNRNRELGLITANQKVLSAIARTFAGDYRNGKHWS
ncbi:MAG: phospholipase D-like domain-containing protein [Streptosporangiaceae bacterium]